MTERRARAVPLIASVLMPGLGHILMGARGAGVPLLVGWLSFLAIPVFAWERVRTAHLGSLDDRIALITLIVVPLLIWGAALRSLVARQKHAPSRDTESQWDIALRRLRRKPLAMAGLWVIAALYAVALLAPLLAPHDPIAQTDIVRLSYRSPSGEFPLGTDRFGRDVLSRILYGARISLAIGFVATAISVTVGTAIGALAGYFGRFVDSALMRFTDVVLAFPRLILLILIVALFQPSLTVIILVLGLTQWPATTRIVRGEVLSLREREFVQAARALGFRHTRIILRHVLPNVIAPVIVTATLGIGNTIVLEAGLAFLGLGLQPPTPTWGEMVNAGRENLLGAWWLATFPGLTIVTVVLAFNVLGDGLRDALDPRLR
jgi:peptide/nickel transport system permease protein